MRWLARLVLLALALGAAALTWTSAARIAADPTLAPLRLAAADEIVAATDRAMVRTATPERLTALIAARLAETPRNWVALDALAAVATERSASLPPGFAEAREQDFGWAAQAGDCAACLWDIAACTLSNVMICKVPILLTPVEDLRGVTRAGLDWSSGRAVDHVDLALSVVGLGATAAVLASGGGSATLKAGAATIRAARGLRLVSPGLEAFVASSLRAGVDPALLAGARGAGDIRQAIRPAALAPLSRMAEDAQRLRRAAGTTGGLHLMRLADNGAEVTRLANAAEALGPRIVGRAEVLGKARLMRATLRVTGTAWELLAGLVALLWSLAGMVGGMAAQGLLRALRRLARG